MIDGAGLRSTRRKGSSVDTKQDTRNRQPEESERMKDRHRRVNQEVSWVVADEVSRPDADAGAAPERWLPFLIFPVSIGKSKIRLVD